jgi:hypothetical protein
MFFNIIAAAAAARERGKKEEVSDALRSPEERKEIFLFPKK